MSFALTTAQIRGRSKTVTRRLGWAKARPGEVAQPVVKGQGLKKGEHVEKINGPIRFIDVRREPLWPITQEDVVREGFPEMTPSEFALMFTRHNRCDVYATVTRIEFIYL